MTGSWAAKPRTQFQDDLSPVQQRNAVRWMQQWVPDRLAGSPLQLLRRSERVPCRIRGDHVAC